MILFHSKDDIDRPFVSGAPDRHGRLGNRSRLPLNANYRASGEQSNRACCRCPFGRELTLLSDHAPLRSTNPIILIPARLAATRLPGKPLAEIAGVPMIVHVWRRAVAAEVGPVVVACGDRAIAEAVESGRRAGGA